jgi:hypothetical protein
VAVYISTVFQWIGCIMWIGCTMRLGIHHAP